ncbi:uncharacterized protein LOC122632483 isoform X1 [Vespula pensylvanica]|uniref:uncharacterized protein LOC122632483 isoform X1 n=1 Tax=Vespula pensylvanica TaxID=30213 RepID=UPI001CBA29DD|nr:uncharacterized protein LOC122632483 isoform X1 [Vespula pensylvanica]
MRRGRSVALRRLLVVVALLSLSAAAYALPAGNDNKRSRTCDISDANNISCSKHERCVQKKINEKIEGVCDCEQGYEYVKDDECWPSVSLIPINSTTVRLDHAEDSGGSSVAAGLLIPTFLIIIGVVLYFGARRYRWLQRFRQYRQRRYGNVLVTRNDDDDDDPPIA